MKKKKSMLSILGLLLLSFTVVSGASAGSPSLPHHETTEGGGSKSPACENGYCPMP